MMRPSGSSRMAESESHHVFPDHRLWKSSDRGFRLITLVPPDQAAQAKPENIAKPSGLKSLKAAFSSKRQTSKTISFEYLPPAGSGEAEVDASGLDIRDVLEEPTIVTFKPVVTRTVPLEKGNEAFRGVPEGVVVRIIH